MDQKPLSARSGQYRHVNSDFYEELESASALNQTCEVTCIDDSGREVLIISRVHDLYSDHGTEYVRLDSQVIPLDRITGVNGRRGAGKVDTELLEKGLVPNATPATENHKYPEEEAQMQMRPNSDITELNRQDEQAAHSQPVAREEAVQRDESSDFVHRFSTAPPPFIIAENDLYQFSADRLKNCLYLKAKQSWHQVGQVKELSSYVERVAPLMTSGFTLLNDLTAIEPDEEGTVWAPPVPNRSALLRSGLVKVADLVSPNCETLVHGTDSFSVNSVRLRYFKDRLQAEHWLITEHQDTDSINLSDHP